MGVTVLTFYHKMTTKGTILASNDCFARGDWGMFQDKHHFSWLESSKSLLKALHWDNERGLTYLSFGNQWKSPPLWSCSIICTLSDVQCKTRELNYLNWLVSYLLTEGVLWVYYLFGEWGALVIRTREGFEWLCLAQVSRFALHFQGFALKAKLHIYLRVTVVDNGKGIHGPSKWIYMAVALSLIWIVNNAGT